jgi:hypothetical protein
VSDSLNYPELYELLEAPSQRLGRRLNPIAYTNEGLSRRVGEGHSFTTRVLTGPKIWLIGGEDDLPAR